MTSRLLVLGGVVGLALLPSVSNAFDHAGQAAVSGRIGGMMYLADADSRDGARPRFLFTGYGEYSPSSRTAIRIGSGLGWNAYAEDKSPTSIESPDPVKVVSPTTITYIRRLNPDQDRHLYVGAGIGIYYWRYKINGKVQTDPQTFERIGSGHIGAFDLGFHGLFGYEYPLTRTVALQAEAMGHYVLSADTEDRPDKSKESGLTDYPVFNGNDAFVGVTLGVKLYFDLVRFAGAEDEY